MYTPPVQKTFMPMAQGYAQSMMPQMPMMQPMMMQQPMFRQIAVGHGIDTNEFNSIVAAATNCYMMKSMPMSSSVTNAIKSLLGGEWVCVVCPTTRNYVFCCSLVKGGDFMSFSLDNTLFQICRLR